MSHKMLRPLIVSVRIRLFIPTIEYNMCLLKSIGFLKSSGRIAHRTEYTTSADH